MHIDVKVVSPGLRVVEEDLTIECKTLTDEDFFGKKLGQFVSINSKFISCKFDNVKIRNACFGSGNKMSTYVGCTFNHAVFSSVTPGNARFERCLFLNVNIKKFHCQTVEFVDCIFSGKIENSFFNGMVSKEKEMEVGRKFNQFWGNDFSGVSFDNVGFRSNIDLTKQKLPINEKYIFIEHAREFIFNRRKDVQSIVDLKLQKNIWKLIDILEYEISEGQEQLYLSINDVPVSLQDAFRWLFH